MLPERGNGPALLRRPGVPRDARDLRLRAPPPHHEVLLFNFFPWLQKYLKHYQNGVTRLLSYVAQVCPEMHVIAGCGHRPRTTRCSCSTSSPGCRSISSPTRTG